MTTLALASLRSAGGARSFLAPVVAGSSVLGGSDVFTQQTRSLFQEAVRPYYNKITGKYEYEQPRHMVFRFYESKQRSRFCPRYSEHEKQWMKRKRIESRKVHRRTSQVVEELTRYIQYMRENKDT